MGRSATETIEDTKERWFFYQDIANLWKWARLDTLGTVLGYSGTAYGTREECVEDARRSGYSGTPWFEKGRSSHSGSHAAHVRASAFK